MGSNGGFPNTDSQDSAQLENSWPQAGLSPLQEYRKRKQSKYLLSWGQPGHGEELSSCVLFLSRLTEATSGGDESDSCGASSGGKKAPCMGPKCLSPLQHSPGFSPLVLGGSNWPVSPRVGMSSPPTQSHLTFWLLAQEIEVNFLSPIFLGLMVGNVDLAPRWFRNDWEWI